jgi:hypothetical protein
MADDNKSAIKAKVKELQDLLVEDGMDRTTAEAITFAAMPPSDNIVGNLADLQRMGAIAVTGSMPAPPLQEEEETTDTNDAFKKPRSSDIDEDRLALGRVDTGDSPPLGENAGEEPTEAPNPAEIVGAKDNTPAPTSKK